MPTYTPVDPDFYDTINELIDHSLTVHYFNDQGEWDTAKGTLDQIKDNGGDGAFLLLNSKDEIRLDRIIALNGKPGPAYDEYDAYANACMECHGGMD